MLVALSLAQAAEEERTGLDLILPPLAELVGGVLAFALVFFVLNRIAFLSPRNDQGSSGHDPGKPRGGGSS